LPGSGKLGILICFKNFKLPQVFKASFAVDQKLPAGFVVSGRLFITIIYLRLLMKTLGNPTYLTELIQDQDMMKEITVSIIRTLVFS
jgi:hypothetical protein